MGPNPSKLTPPEIHQSASPSCYFLRPGRDPPEKSRFAKIYIFTMICNDFSADRGPKMEPPGATADFATPPPGSQKSPRKSARGPPGPKKRPPDLVKGPRDLRAAPRGAQGGDGGVPHILLHVPANIDGFPGMLLWLTFRACFFFSKPDLNWAARSHKFVEKYDKSVK